METQQKSWFGRNWLWVVPVGGCLTIILLFVFGIGVAIFGVTKIMKNSEPYEYAVKTALDNDELISIIGEPIETNGMTQGSIEYKNGKGFVDISVPLIGPNGKAIVFIKGEKVEDKWNYEEFYITVKSTGNKINLLDKSLEGI